MIIDFILVLLLIFIDTYIISYTRFHTSIKWLFIVPSNALVFLFLHYHMGGVRYMLGAFIFVTLVTCLITMSISVDRSAKRKDEGQKKELPK